MIIYRKDLGKALVPIDKRFMLYSIHNSNISSLVSINRKLTELFDISDEIIDEFSLNKTLLKL